MTRSLEPCPNPDCDTRKPPKIHEKKTSNKLLWFGKTKAGCACGMSVGWGREYTQVERSEAFDDAARRWNGLCALLNKGSAQTGSWRAIQNERQDGLCFYCGQYMKFRTVDHVWPRALGGSSHKERNCVLACLPCNAEKADREPARAEIERFEALMGFSPARALIRQSKKPQKGAKPTNKRSGKKKYRHLRNLLIEADRRVRGIYE